MFNRKIFITECHLKISKENFFRLINKHLKSKEQILFTKKIFKSKGYFLQKMFIVKHKIDYAQENISILFTTLSLKSIEQLRCTMILQTF